MRLLAYGGTSYVERRRIGEWPAILEGALSDTYSLSIDKPAYGVGLLGEAPQPFLVFRQRQNVQNRGGYAFTLLLDPGSEIWEREDFAYNGAKLLSAIQSGDEELVSLLFSRPEELTENHLENFLQHLSAPPHPLNSVELELEPLCALWAGSVMQQSPVIFSPQDIGLDSRPSLECVALALDLLPLPFRCGRGWLIGGSEEHSRAYGALLTLDEGIKTGGAEVVACMEAGRSILRDWRMLETYEGGILKNTSKFPVWKWKATGYPSHERFIRDIGVIARSYRAQTPEERETYIRDSENPGYEESPLHQNIQDKAYQMRVSGTGVFSPRQTLRALEEHFKGKSELKIRDAQRLDFETLVGHFVQKNISPSFVVCLVQLDWPSRLHIWHKLLTEVEPVETLPARCKEALADLVADPTSVSSEISALAEIAVTHSLTKTRDLRVWLAWRSDPVLTPWVSELLQDKARQRAFKKQGSKWPLEYLAFGQDLGGERFARACKNEVHGAILVNSLLSYVTREDDLGGTARRWLMKLAASQLRLLLPLETKFHIAKSLVEEWRWFLALWTLYYGQQSYPEHAAKIEEDERRRLCEELNALINRKDVRSAAPNLRGLVELLGDIPPPLLERLARTKPKLTSWKGEQNWFEGWCVAGRPDIYQAELLRFVKDSSLTKDGFKDSLAELIAQQLNDKGLCELIKFFLAEGSDSIADSSDSDQVAIEDVKLYVALARLLKAGTRGKERLNSALDTVLQGVAQDASCASRFAQRFKRLVNGRKKILAPVVFTDLRPETQHRWFSIIAATEQEWFAERVSDLYGRVVNMSSELLAYERTVLEFLRSPEGEEIRGQINTWHHGLFSGGEIESNLQEILDVQEDKSEDKELRGDEVPALPRRSWADRWQPFLPRILHSLLFGKSKASGESPAQIPEAEGADNNSQVKRAIAGTEATATLPSERDDHAAGASAAPKEAVLTHPEVNHNGRAEE